MSKFVICRGLPASGKSTWAKAWVEEDPDGRARVNRDDIRYSMFGKGWGVDEDVVTAVQQAALRAAFKSDKDVVCDDTNLNSKVVRKLLKIAAEYNAEVEYNDSFLDVPPIVCVSRDLMREPSVGSGVITQMVNRYFAGGKRPKRPEPVADERIVAEPYVGDPELPRAILVDLDGTIAKNDGHRGYFEWAKVGNDKPIKEVIEIVQALWNDGYQIIFVSGRDSICFGETWEWIRVHVFYPMGKWDANPQLIMRAHNDMRKDSIVKLEIFDREIRNNYNVVACFDDRNQVVDAYRSIGLRVLQVAPGAF